MDCEPESSMGNFLNLVTTITKGKLSDGSSDGGWSKMDSTEPEYSMWNLLLI